MITTIFVVALLAFLVWLYVWPHHPASPTGTRQRDELAIVASLPIAQQSLFLAEMARVRKNTTTAVLLALFLGGLGAHRFYLGYALSGLLYVLFVWTFIPSIVALFEAFTMTGTVARMNAEQAEQIAARLTAATTTP